jgi:hypothetical protein
MTYLDSRYTLNTNTRLVQQEWHELVIATARAERIFRDRGDTREADQVRIYANLFSQYAFRHLDRIANGNGHTKDSTPETEQGPTTADENVVCTDGGSHADGCVTPFSTEPVAAAEPGIEDRIQTLIAQMEDAMVKHPDNQGYEVAIKFLHRARSLAREGKFELAERQLRAAENAAGEAKEMGVT